MTRRDLCPNCRKNKRALDAIAAIMNNQPWNNDTLTVIAAITRTTNRPIRKRRP